MAKARGSASFFLKRQGAKGHTTVAIVERVDDQEVEGEQPDQQHRMMLLCLRRRGAPVDELVEVELDSCRWHGLEADLDRSVWGPVDDEVVRILETSSLSGGLRPQETVQMQDQSDVERLPRLIEEISSTLR